MAIFFFSLECFYFFWKRRVQKLKKKTKKKKSFEESCDHSTNKLRLSATVFVFFFCFPIQSLKLANNLYTVTYSKRITSYSSITLMP